MTVANQMRLCPSCRKWTSDKVSVCDTCGEKLILSDLTDIYWKKASEDEKEKLTQKYLPATEPEQMDFWEKTRHESTYSVASGEDLPYVVLQVTLKEKLIGTGSGNLTELEEVINRQVAKGYRLHTITTASGGSKGLMGGDRIQATMVFERIDLAKAIKM